MKTKTKIRGGGMRHVRKSFPNKQRSGTPHEVMHDRTVTCNAPPRCLPATVLLGEELSDIHTAATDDEGHHTWHAWISGRAEVGIGTTEMEAIEHLGRIHAAIDCGFCGKNLTECECPQPL